MAPGTLIQPFLAMAAAPVVGGRLPHFELSIWHGFNAPFIMSLIALGGGLVMFLLLRKGLRAGRYATTPLLSWANGQRMFEWVLDACNLSARKFQQVFHTRRLQPQVLLLILVSIGTMAASLWHSGFGFGDRPRVPGTWEFWLVWAVGCACALGAANQAKFHRLAALIMLGGAGLATCLTFVWFSAPDLALTQLAVEVVTTILFLLGLRWLPKRVHMDTQTEKLRARLRRSRDFLVSAGVGMGLAVLSYALMTRSAPQSISPFYLERALPEGGGTNVVNVMLVDFRAFDTMGEIVVLGAVALTVFALLRRFRPPKESLVAPHQQRAIPDLDTDLVNPRTAEDTALGYLMVPAVLARVMLPVMGLFALHLFLRGHNEPGGGFVAGLIVSIGFITQYMMAGTTWVEARINLYLRRWIAVGMVVAIATGLGSLFFGYPFLTTHTAHLHLPVFGEVHLASAVFFDIGVFAVVVGATLLTLTALAHQSVRRQRKVTAADEPTPAEIAQREGVVRAPNSSSEGDE
jgi:multicomponent K+:H+ antiporter subunit A